MSSSRTSSDFLSSISDSGTKGANHRRRAIEATYEKAGERMVEEQQHPWECQVQTKGKKFCKKNREEETDERPRKLKIFFWEAKIFKQKPKNTPKT